MRCRRWKCPRCGPAMRNRLVHLVEQSPPDRMLTLTIDPSLYSSPFHGARRMSWAFSRLVALMRRFSKPEPVEYLAVWERTKAGWPHLHVLLRGPFIPQRLVSRWWGSLTGSPVVYFTYLGGARAGGRYVAKYLTKDPDPFASGRALRASRNFLVEPMRPQGQRYCTLGPLRVYEGRAWEWLADQLSELRLVEVDDAGQCASATWARCNAPETVLWLRWERQRAAVTHLERPPPPPGSSLLSGVWAERPVAPAMSHDDGSREPPHPGATRKPLLGV